MRLLPVSFTCLILALQWVGTGQIVCAQTFRITPSGQQGATIKSATLDVGSFRYHNTDSAATDLNVNISVQVPAPADTTKHELGSITWKLGDQAATDLNLTAGEKALREIIRPVNLFALNPQSGTTSSPAVLLATAVFKVNSTLTNARDEAVTAAQAAKVASDNAPGDTMLKAEADRTAAVAQSKQADVDRATSTLPASLNSTPLILIVDNEGPKLTEPTPKAVLAGTILINIPFRDVDIDESSLNASAFTVHLRVNRTGETQPTDVGATVLSIPRLSLDRKSCEIEIEGRGAGTYAITAQNLKDLTGNETTSFGPVYLNVGGGPSPAQRGDHIEFPDYLGRNGAANEAFNPNEKVETRVVRLYYNRDAHRVAQIINRNAIQLNRSGVDFANDQAIKARTKADDAEDARKLQELKAIRAVQRGREARKTIEQSQAALGRNNLAKAQLESRKKQAEAGIAAENAKTDETPDKEKIASLQGSVDVLTAQIENLDTSTQAAQLRLNDAQQELSAAQSEEVKTSETLQVNQSQEDRARLDQFRKEVIAGTTDPDTYAAARKNSIDPVTQVSITVVGEGLIHLRGPVRGINKIARMIHQLDMPVGQVKVGIHTVQVNGEHGDRMELVYERIDKHIAHSRFLVHESLQAFRKAVMMVASECAASVDRGYIPPGAEDCPADLGPPSAQQVRNWRYLNVFFGRDFIAELLAMDSELLKMDNKLLSLNSMDTLSLSGALYVAAVADHPVREQILMRFRDLTVSELPEKEVDYYRALTRIRHPDPCVNGLIVAKYGNKLDARDAKRIWEKAFRTYQYSNLVGFFDAQLAGEGTLNAAQHATIRLAQALKAQLVSELEYRNLVLERSLMERNDRDTEFLAQQAADTKKRVLQKESDASAHGKTARQTILSVEKTVIERVKQRLSIAVVEENRKATEKIATAVNENVALDQRAQILDVLRKTALSAALDSAGLNPPVALQQQDLEKTEVKKVLNAQSESVVRVNYTAHLMAFLGSKTSAQALRTLSDQLFNEFYDDLIGDIVTNRALAERQVDFALKKLGITEEQLIILRQTPLNDYQRKMLNAADDKATPMEIRDWAKQEFTAIRETAVAEVISNLEVLRSAAVQFRTSTNDLAQARRELDQADRENKAAQSRVFAKRVLEQSIDEAEERAVELSEAMRSHVANVDNYLKRLATAIEDDMQAQFYNPAFQDIRRASRYWDVTLGQIETTTILTNNRAFAKVSPSATMEFDLPQRDIVLTEAMKGSKALMQEYGNLVKDPSFIAGAAIFQGTPPGLNAAQSPLQTIPSEYGGTRPEPGAALQALIPEPAVYKFETGTGFEIRPVIQPDGHSIVYGFDYMYTTNVREPVRADEKHLGRVKRHLVHTDVQTSSYELREVSKYMVALKASRTSRGVPLFEDVPLIGGLFRPLPSQESSLQQNIILASSVIYPTLFDLMGLRWSPYADDLSSGNLPRQKSRENEIKRRYRSNLLQQARTAVNENIGGGVQLPPELRTEYHEPEHLFERTPAPAEELLPPGYPTPSPQPTELPGTSRLRSTPLRLESDQMPVERDPGLPGREHLRDATLPDPTLPETKPNEEALPLPGVSRRPASRPGAPKPSRPVASTSNPRPTERAVPASRPQQPMASRPAHRDSAVQPAGYEEPAPRPALRPSVKPPMTSGPIRGSGPSQRR